MNKLNYKKLPWKNEIDFYDLHSKDIFSKFPFYHLSMIGNTREEFSNYIINKVGINKGSKVIDAGCGGGYLTNTINDICDVVGISTSGECIKQAKLNYPNTDFRVGNMETYVDKDITHFLCLESLHYSDIKKTFKNVYNNLSSGGIFYMKEWYKHHDEIDVEKENRKHWEHYFKYKGYTIPNVIQLAYDEGFVLSSATDITDKMNNDMYGKASKYHKARFTLPYDDVNFIFPAELMFIKK
jgi:SAM-dependent methyltransferase